MLNCGPPPLSCDAEREEPVAIRPERAPAAGEVLLDQLERERVVPGGHRRVRREDRGLRRISSSASSNVEPCSISSRIRCRTTNAACPSFRWNTAGSTPSALQRAHAADAEDDLLLDARLAIAAVEPRRQLAVPRRVLLEVGVEQIELTRPTRTRQTATSTDRSPSGTAVMHGLPSGVERRLDRRVRPVEPLVALLLPAFGGDVLVEISLRIHEADADRAGRRGRSASLQ